MDCNKAAEVLVRRIYHEADPDEERDLFEHLSDCPACREMDQDYRAISRILDREPSESFLPSGSGKASRWGGWRRWGPAVAAACLLVGVIAVQGVSFQIGSWGIQLGSGGSAFDRTELQRIVRAELGNVADPMVTAGLEQLRQTVSRQNEMLAFLAGAQQRNQVLTTRTFDEMERRMGALWMQEGGSVPSVLPAGFTNELAGQRGPEEDIFQER